MPPPPRPAAFSGLAGPLLSGTPRLYCEGCGDRIDPAFTGIRPGLCRCHDCGVHACRRCWADALGTCPGCGVSFVGGPAAIPPRQRRRRTARFRRPAVPRMPVFWPRDLRVPVAAALVVALVVTSVLVLGNLSGPRGGVAGVIGRPSATPSASPSGRTAAVPSPSAAPKPVRTSTPRTPDSTPGRRTPNPTARPTDAPTPRPTPRPGRSPAPTPRPSPKPACVDVPKLVGLKVTEARAAWSDAGFTGPLNPAVGHNNKTVQSQSLPAGACRPASTTITVTYG